MDLFEITDGNRCEDICKYAPPENKWPCVDCDMRYHDRAESKELDKCQYCGKTENVCLIEIQKETFTIRKYLCEECYSRSKGKGFVDLLNLEPMRVKE